jgi:PST family polysaccharide transporter
VDFASLVILARLLTPEDFGLIAMASVLLNILRIVGDGGLVMASTQQKRLLDAQISTLFWINVGAGTILAVFAIGCAPILIAIFGEPRIMGVTAALSVTILAIGIGAQHEAIIRRKLKYTVLHIADVVSQAFGLVAGVISALIGFGVWALVAYQIVARIVRTSWLWVGSGWRPGKLGRAIDVKEIVQYGGRFVPVQMLAHASRSVGEMIVGATAGVVELGLYRRAHGLLMVIEQLKQPLKAMMPASLSRLQDRSQEYILFYLNSLTMWCFVAIPAVGYVVSEAPFIVRMLLGDQWIGAVPLVRMLGGAGLATALGAATEWLLLPLAEMRKLIVLRVVRASIIVVGILAGWRWGVTGIAVGYSVAACISVVIEITIATRGKQISRSGLIMAFTRPTIAAAVASTVVLAVPDDLPVLVQVMGLLLYIVVFLVAHSLVPGGWVVTRRTLRALRAATRQVGR